ncbi:terminase large subunit domain-containing protein [Ensifer adhaerens]|uniref:Terminase family protein n=1 Tax=Ensifer adhaerens TaxID=106592 RepID=A0A9Q8YBP8_ENSAD|nr:terminase family protein [Ensifer adhaerens]USJ25190.1 terminase family protein [Ensifer adhaerens]
MNNSSSGSASSTRPSGLSLLLRERMELTMEIGRRQNTNRLRYYQPYTKQTAFHEAGATFRERLFMAGNQLGKTLAGAAEAAMHLTGDYPSWWAGRRFDRPITMIGGSESHELTRDGVQRLLVGPPMSEEDWGTGYLPKAAISGWTRRSSASGALDSVTVRHTSGGTSTLLLKAYEQGRAKWQANTVDYLWFDEEPPEDVYFEGIMLQRMQTGRFKVFSTCGDWFEEFRLYHRKDGRIVKERDDVISASRYALMMKRFARVKADNAAWAFTDRKVL